jgi:ankyrin repeat protein
MKDSDLYAAARSGDIERIRSALDAGADIRYIRPSRYSVIIDAIYGCAAFEPARLMPILRLLIERGADLDVQSDYGESAIRITSRTGRFDAVGLLLAAGANPEPLEWTELHFAVALGTVEDVRRRLDAGDDLGARDRWERTPMLLSLQSRDIEKARLVLAAGGSLADRGRCGMTAPMYPVEVDDPEMLRWLLEQGVDPDATDDFGEAAIRMAAATGSSKCIRTLLSAGADPNHRCSDSTPIKSAANLECARILAEAGANFADIHRTVLDELTRLRRTESIECTPDEYKAARHRIFGNANPQLMNFPFWQAMVSSGTSASHARRLFDEGRRLAEPVWCFQRMGQTFTELPDGRVIEIAGEHEDSYDPDFCIYNDVIVHHGDGTFDIYGYPRDVFPPTDFHTATLVGESIFIIGNFGNYEDRRYGHTQVYRLDIRTLAMESVDTRGEPPGWFSSHRARLIGNSIEAKGGSILESNDGKENWRDNHDTYLLDLSTMTWSKSRCART